MKIELNQPLSPSKINVIIKTFHDHLRAVVADKSVADDKGKPGGTVDDYIRRNEEMILESITEIEAEKERTFTLGDESWFKKNYFTVMRAYAAQLGVPLEVYQNGLEVTLKINQGETNVSN